jgi:hypothetical protein
MTDTADALREMTMLLERAVDGRFGPGSKLEAKVVTMCRAARRTLSAPADATRDGAPIAWLIEMLDGSGRAITDLPYFPRVVLNDHAETRPTHGEGFRVTALVSAATEAAAGTPAGMPPQEWVRKLDALLDQYGVSGFIRLRNELRSHVLSRVAEPADVAELRKALEKIEALHNENVGNPSPFRAMNEINLIARHALQHGRRP